MYPHAEIMQERLENSNAALIYSNIHFFPNTISDWNNLPNVVFLAANFAEAIEHAV